MLSLEGKSKEVVEREFEEKIQSLLEEENFQEMVDFCVEFELEIHSLEMKHVQHRYPTHLLLLLLLGDLQNARFLWKRIPQNIKDKSPELKAIWEIGKAMWHNNHPLVFLLASSPPSSSSSSSSSSSPSPTTLVLYAFLTQKYRERVWELVEKCYSSISISQLSQMVGLGEEEVKGEVKERGWEGEEGWVVVKKKGGRGGKGVTMEGMRKMTEYVVYLEESIGVAQ